METLQNKNNLSNGKEILKNLLNKTFESKLHALELKATSHIDSLKNTSISFNEFKTTLAKLVKETNNKPNMSIEIPNKNLLRSKTTENLTDRSSPKKTLPKGKTNTTKSSLRKRNFSLGSLLKSNKGNPKSNNNKTIENKKKLNQSAYITNPNKKESTSKKNNDLLNKTTRTMKKLNLDIISKSNNNLNKSAIISSNKNKNTSKKVKNFNFTERYVQPKETENEIQSKLNKSGFIKSSTPSNLKGKKVKDSIKAVNIKQNISKGNNPKPKTIKKTILPNNFFDKNKDETWLDIIISFLQIKDKLSFTTSSKTFIHKYLLLLTSFENTINSAMNLEEGETINERIETLITRAKEKEDKPTYSEFQISKGTIRAIELFNGESYNKIFKIVKLDPQMKDIVIIYRILFLFLNEESIANIENDNAFWLQCCEYLHKKGNDNRIGSYLLSAANNFNFEDRNIFLISKLISQKQVILVPSYYSKICATTGLIMFLIKDSLEYCGIIYSEKRTPYNRMLNNALYAKKLLERVKKIKEIALKF